jgi:protein tyrosine/serine phosphatase
MTNRIKLLAAVALITLVSIIGCTTQTQPSTDIISQASQPSPVFNFHVVDHSGIYRSGQPIGSSDWDYLKTIGITKVIRLNEFASDPKASEEFQLAKDRGIEIVPIYMQPEDAPHNLNPWAQPELSKVNKALDALENRGNGKVLLHCSHGKDRTGLIAALYKVRNKNLCKSAAFEEMKFYGTSPFLFGLKPLLFDTTYKEQANCVSDFKSIQ